MFDIKECGMPVIIIENLHQTEIKTKQTDRKVIDLIHENYTDWMHACGKKGKCTTCKMIVLSGMENLSPKSAAEERFYQLGRLKADERLTCQTRLLKGSLNIMVAEEDKLPHISYSA